MKLLFAHDHILHYFDDQVYSDKLPYEVWKRYLKFFDKMTVFTRFERVTKVPSSAISSGDRVSFYGAANISSLKSFLGLRKKEFLKLRDEIQKVDAVVARLPSEYGLAAVDIAKKLGKPVMVEVVACPWDALWNNGSLSAKLYAPYFFWKMKRTVEKSDYALYVSNNFLQSRYPSVRKTIGVSDVELPLNSKYVLNSRLEKVSKESIDFKIGLIGNFKTKYKGIDIAIKSLAEVNEKSNIGFHLHILGQGDSTEYLDLARSLHIKDFVHFDGVLPAGKAIFDWLDDIDVYIQPSLQEGMPRAVLEAMSRACPVVASNVGGIPEILDSNFIIPTKNSKELAAKILELVSDPQLMLSQAEKNFNTAKDFQSDLLNAKRDEFFEDFTQFIQNGSEPL